MPGKPPPFEHRFTDLTTVVDEVHALFASWVEEGTYAKVIQDTELYVMQLAVHEWVANLVQHADFGARQPEVRLTVRFDKGGCRCEIEDNSDGFDLYNQLGQQEVIVTETEPEPSERGRGLLMLLACTEDLQYEPTSEGRQRLAFSIRPPVALGSLLPLFPASDDDAEGDGVALPVQPSP